MKRGGPGKRRLTVEASHRGPSPSGRDLVQTGALDAWATPVTMKKGRPGLVVSALARAAESARIAEIMLRETTSIGARITEATRIERPRTTVVVETRYGDVPVKVSSGPYGEPVAKPEFDVCAELD